MFLFFTITTYYFAILGFLFFCKELFDLYTSKKCKFRANIIITDIQKTENTEYAIRILESHVANHSAFGFVNKIIVPKNMKINTDLLQKLSQEYKNIDKGG